MDGSNFELISNTFWEIIYHKYYIEQKVGGKLRRIVNGTTNKGGYRRNSRAT